MTKGEKEKRRKGEKERGEKEEKGEYRICKNVIKWIGPKNTDYEMHLCIFLFSSYYITLIAGFCFVAVVLQISVLAMHIA